MYGSARRRSGEPLELAIREGPVVDPEEVHHLAFLAPIDRSWPAPVFQDDVVASFCQFLLAFSAGVDYRAQRVLQREGMSLCHPQAKGDIHHDDQALLIFF